MSKIIGGIFFVIGFIFLAVLRFLYLNSSNFLDYNDPAKHLSFFQTGYALPTVLFTIMFAVGVIFLFFSKEPNLK